LDYKLFLLFIGGVGCRVEFVLFIGWGGRIFIYFYWDFCSMILPLFPFFYVETSLGLGSLTLGLINLFELIYTFSLEMTLF